MISRLRVEYEDEGDSTRLMAKLRLSGMCNECALWIEGKVPHVRMFEKEA